MKKVDVKKWLPTITWFVDGVAYCTEGALSMILPDFTKDISGLRGYNYDIRDIVIGTDDEEFRGPNRAQDAFVWHIPSTVYVRFED